MAAHPLQAELAQLRERHEIETAATRAALVTLVRYLAEGQQLHIDELCNDLDALCLARPEPLWQHSLMGLTELLRGIDEGLPGDAG